MTWRPEVEAYFRRYGQFPELVTARPNGDLELVVVIPSHDEPDLMGTLESLRACWVPDAGVEVIVVINGSAGAAQSIKERNRRAYHRGVCWAAALPVGRVAYHFVLLEDFPDRHAGVGLARKAGMDEAVRRFSRAGRYEAGVIVGLDADCRCDPDYFTALVAHFREDSGTPGCSIYFEHPVGSTGRWRRERAIAGYELHLRYYVRALAFCGFPFAHHTVGSAMAVRVPAYVRQGGMNRRKAGEDFYFLQKIMALGEFTDLTATRVLPSPRDSHRVPFGTGRAMGVLSIGETSEWTTYTLESWLDLRQWLSQVPVAFQVRSWRHPSLQLPESIRAFLPASMAEEALQRILANTASETSFYRQFFQWLNGFRVLKFLHFARDRGHSPSPVTREAIRLLRAAGVGRGEPSDFPEEIGRASVPEPLLEFYRRWERFGEWGISH